MEILIPNAQTYEDIIAKSKTQIFFSGGHGGLVTYDGKGGCMEKEGGPIDRIYVLRSEGELGGDHGLDIVYGSVRFRTGSLSTDVDITCDEAGDTVGVFTFDGNDDKHAVEICGGIHELELPNDTVLFHGSVEPSEMRWITGDVTKRPPTLPYTALSTYFEIHPFIAKRFELELPVRGLVVYAWCKPAGVIFRRHAVTKHGAAFRTQQHLGTVRMFVQTG